jgi:hypothetical protein
MFDHFVHDFTPSVWVAEETGASGCAFFSADAEFSSLASMQKPPPGRTGTAAWLAIRAAHQDRGDEREHVQSAGIEVFQVVDDGETDRVRRSLRAPAGGAGGLAPLCAGREPFRSSPALRDACRTSGNAGLQVKPARCTW